MSAWGCVVCGGRSPFGKDGRWYCSEHWLEFVAEHGNGERYYLGTTSDELVPLHDNNVTEYDGIIAYVRQQDAERFLTLVRESK